MILKKVKNLLMLINKIKGFITNILIVKRLGQMFKISVFMSLPF